MPELDDITYSREETIAAVSDYYHFLTAMYMKDSQVIQPPPEGWPSIVNADPVLLRSLGKTNEVMSLLAHLPYIRSYNNSNNDADALPWNMFADWQQLLSPCRITNMEERGEDIRVMTEGAAFYKLAPPHVFSLTCGDRETPAIILDTELGIIHWDECPARIEQEYFESTVDWDLDDDVPEEEADWRHSATAWSIPDFFEVLKDQLIKLHWIPISPYSIRSTSDNLPNNVGMIPMLQNIYRQHGWPDLAVYRKAECLAAIKKALTERYPESVCGRG